MGGDGHNAHKQCGFSEVALFIFALIGGTLCSLTSKVLLTMKGRGMTGETENFSYPLFQTFGMFLGMTGALVMHFVVLKFRIPFPGYTHKSDDEWEDEDDSLLKKSRDNASAKQAPNQPIPWWKYCQLVIPSIFDLVATCLAMFGLRHVSVSIYQMLRGSAIIFVALLKQFALGHKLQKFKWIGIGYNVVSIVIVGLTAMLIGSEGAEQEEVAGIKQRPLFGVILILCGAFVQSLQYVFEEMVMSAENDIPVPPLLLIGMEGFWGSVICLFILYPIAYHMPGEDHGSVENPYNTVAMISNTPAIQAVFTLYFFSILLYNVLALLVTFMLDSVWHAILDNFRPITVWGMDLFIFYCVTQNFGEKWSAQWSWLQLLGMFILLYGTGIYNAPNPGSILLTGKAQNCYLDLSHEYDAINNSSSEEHARILDGNANGLKSGDSTPFYSGMSPFVMMSPAAQDRQKARQKQNAIAGKYELRNLSAQQPINNANKKNYGGVNDV